ncbi:MAG: LysR substrate-binding domain-containing protein [Terriglobales bacterium]
MDFDQINTFLEVARLHSFSRAAVTCYRTQPAISAQIRLLEEEAGARLFDRGGGKVALTAAGRVFHEYASRLRQLRKEALDAVADLNHTPQGELSLAANEGSCLHVLPEVFARFKRRHAAVRVHIRRGEHADILEAVLENRVDFGLVSLPAGDPRLQVVPLHRDEIVAVVSPGHALAARAARAPDADHPVAEWAQVAEYPLVLPKSGSTRDALDERLQPYASRLRISMELESTELVKAFAAAGLGVGFVGRTLALAEARSGQLALVALAGPKLYRELGLVFRRDRALGRAALAFIDMAIQASASPDGSAGDDRPEPAEPSGA